MQQTDIKQIAQEFLVRLGGGAAPEQVAELCSTELDWNIPGDTGALPWIGHRSGRQAVVDFVRESRALMEPISFEVRDMLVSDSRVAVLGELASKFISTGKVGKTSFAIVLTIADGQITHFLMLEDSYSVSQAARK
jgi:ketosteroid isomerase-like protein